MNLKLAVKAFFKVLNDKSAAVAFEQALIGAGKVEAATPSTPLRSEALTLVSLLQREGRLVDFLKETIDAYSDAQVGAAVRGIHRDCAAVLDRVFAIEPLNTQSEGSQVTTPAKVDPGCYHLTGNVTGTPPFTGVLRHPGWVATKCDVPVWSGTPETAKVIAPTEVELA